MGNSQQFTMPQVQAQQTYGTNNNNTDQQQQNNQKPILQSFGVTSRPCDSIRKILRDYEIGPNIFIELLQNSDDAKCDTVKFFLVEKEFNLDFQKIQNPFFSSNINQTMGPALYIYDDGEFTQKNQIDISFIAAEGKIEDISKTGKFGVGFRSVHHLSDLPGWVSHLGFSYQDPLGLFIDPIGANKHGVQGPLQTLLDNNDQFEHFSALAKYTIFSKENSNNKNNQPVGKLFRLPLRQKQFVQDYLKIQKTVPEHEKQKLISEKIIDSKQILEWFKSFQEDSASQILLFLKWITNIEFYHWKKKAKEPELIYKVEIEKNKIENFDNFRNQKFKPHEDLGQLFKDGKLKQQQQKKTKNQTQQQQSQLPNIIHQTQEINIIQTTKSSKKLEIVESNWIITSGVGGSQCLTMFDKEQYDYRPLGGVATCLKSEIKKQGRMFCMLPLPIINYLPFSLNGFFILDSSRRNVLIESQTRIENKDIQWNKAIMNDLLVELAYENLSKVLQILKDQKNYFQIEQVIPEKVNSNLNPLTHTFSRNLLVKLYINYDLFPYLNLENGQIEFQKGKNLCFIEPKLTNNSFLNINNDDDSTKAITLDQIQQKLQNNENIESIFYDPNQYNLLKLLNKYLQQNHNTSIALFAPPNLMKNFQELIKHAPEIKFQILTPDLIIKNVSENYRKNAQNPKKDNNIFQTPDNFKLLMQYCEEPIFNYLKNSQKYLILDFPFFMNQEEKMMSLAEIERLEKPVILYEKNKFQKDLLQETFGLAKNRFCHSKILDTNLMKKIISISKENNTISTNFGTNYKNIQLLNTEILIQLVQQEYELFLLKIPAIHVHCQIIKYELEQPINFDTFFNNIFSSICDSQEKKNQFFQHQFTKQLPIVELYSMNRNFQAYTCLEYVHNQIFLNITKGKQQFNLFTKEIEDILTQLNEFQPIYAYNELDQQDEIADQILKMVPNYEFGIFQQKFIEYVSKNYINFFQIPNSQFNFLKFISDGQRGFVRILSSPVYQNLKNQVMHLPIWQDSKHNYISLLNITNAVLIDQQINPEYDYLVKVSGLNFLSLPEDFHIKEFYQIFQLKQEDFGHFFCVRILSKYKEMVISIQGQEKSNKLEIKQKISYLQKIFPIIIKEIYNSKAKLFQKEKYKSIIETFYKSNIFYNSNLLKFMPLTSIIYVQNNNNLNIQNESNNNSKKSSQSHFYNNNNNNQNRKIYDANDFHKQSIDLQYLFNNNQQFSIVYPDTIDQQLFQILQELQLLNYQDPSTQRLFPNSFYTLCSSTLNAQSHKLEIQGERSKDFEQNKEKVIKIAQNLLISLDREARYLQTTDQTQEIRQQIIILQQIKDKQIFPNMNQYIAENLKLNIPPLVLFKQNSKILYKFSEIQLLVQYQNLQIFNATYHIKPNCIIESNISRIFYDENNGIIMPKQATVDQCIEQIKLTAKIFNNYSTDEKRISNWIYTTHDYCWSQLNYRCQESRQTTEKVLREMQQNDIILVDRNALFIEYDQKVLCKLNEVTKLPIQCEPIIYFARIFEDKIFLRNLIPIFSCEQLQTRISIFCSFINRQGNNKIKGLKYPVMNSFQHCGLLKAIQHFELNIQKYYNQFKKPFNIDKSIFHAPVTQNNRCMLVPMKKCYVIDNDLLRKQVNTDLIISPDSSLTQQICLSLGCQKLSTCLEYYLAIPPVIDPNLENQRKYWNEFLLKPGIVYAINRLLAHSCSENGSQFLEMNDVETVQFQTIKIQFVRQLLIRVGLKQEGQQQLLDITNEKMLNKPNNNNNAKGSNVSDFVDLNEKAIYLLNDFTDREWIAQLISLSIIKLLRQIRPEFKEVTSQQLQLVFLSDGKFDNIKMRLDRFNIIDLKEDTEVMKQQKRFLIEQEELEKEQLQKENHIRKQSDQLEITQQKQENIDNKNQNSVDILQIEQQQQNNEKDNIKEDKDLEKSQQQLKNLLKQQNNDLIVKSQQIPNNNNNCQQQQQQPIKLQHECEKQEKIKKISQERLSTQQIVQQSGQGKQAQNIQQNATKKQEQITKIMQNQEIHAQNIQNSKILTLNGIKIFYEKTQFEIKDIHENMPKIQEMSKIICQIAKEVFELKNVESLGIILENTNRIAFNLDSCIYFNVCYWEYACNRVGGQAQILEEAKIFEIYAFFYVTFCHELAHNKAKGHNSQHEFLMESIIIEYLSRFNYNLIQKLGMNQQQLQQNNNNKNISTDSKSQLRLRRSRQY